MEERINLTAELSSVQYDSFPEIFSKFKTLSEKYNNLPMENLLNAFGMVGGFGIGSMYTPNPYVQNTRVKGISSRPANYSKNEVAEFIENPYQSEEQLRQIEHALEFSAYPLFHTRKVYQELLSYHNYVAPYLNDKEDAQRDDFWREWKLLEKFRRELDPETVAHQAAGQALQEGKVFYYMRTDVDKVHNRVNYAYAQQLPSDYCKIVGFNNKSKYTIAFNLMYFTEYGTDYRQFGKLFEPYIGDFNEAIYPRPATDGRKIVYASKSKINLAAVNDRNDTVNAYFQNGRWFYWVNLPVDEVFTFEVDDVNRAVVSPFTGLFIDMIQLSQLEAIQLSLVQNPLVSILHGEIPYWDEKKNDAADQYKLSNSGRRFFESLWYQMLAQNNTGGIGLYMAPLENMKLETLSEAPSAMNIVTQGYTDTMSKAGLTALIPVGSDARAGAVQVSLQIESKFAKAIYDCMERMVNVTIDKLNLKYSWKFRMFGDIYSDDRTEERVMKGMEHGILSDTIIYLAIRGKSILEDIGISDAIVASDIMNKRLPLVASYSMKQEKSGLPPQANHDQNPGGRPSSEGVATSDGQEGDIDSGV